MNDLPTDPSEEPVDGEGDPIEAAHAAAVQEPARSATRPRWARWAAGALVVVVLALGGFLGAKALSGKASASATAGAPAASNAPNTGGASNARSGPATGGASGAVDSVSASGFTMTTPAGQKVTVHVASSTTFQNGTSPTSGSAITTDENVLVLGTTSGTDITATQVIVHPTGGNGSAAASAAAVVPFQRGAPNTSKQVGQIPATYTQGSGTIVGGTTANKATEAALAAYPGGIVDRVVKLSDGEYEVHYIGVNWPHHIFVNQDFKVVGAD
jgi:hypothetical protein